MTSRAKIKKTVLCHACIVNKLMSVGSSCDQSNRTHFAPSKWQRSLSVVRTNHVLNVNMHCGRGSTYPYRTAAYTRFIHLETASCRRHAYGGWIIHLQVARLNQIREIFGGCAIGDDDDVHHAIAATQRHDVRYV